MEFHDEPHWAQRLELMLYGRLHHARRAWFQHRPQRRPALVADAIGQASLQHVDQPPTPRPWWSGFAAGAAGTVSSLKVSVRR